MAKQDSNRSILPFYGALTTTEAKEAPSAPQQASQEVPVRTALLKSLTDERDHFLYDLPKTSGVRPEQVMTVIDQMIDYRLIDRREDEQGNVLLRITQSGLKFLGA